ncbi:hypothetical protein [Arthrobacter oryzae]|uniref:Cardiolipin synthase N-terminal domain-containing protein n=1 Tax=Arthrobacter oryzae TaxID=409290 RepID=A0A495E6E0_9MICC|nr:hypothetical protein C8D78_3888 [Arthrobacter oryzae]
MGNPDAKGAVVAVNMGKKTHKKMHVDLHQKMHMMHPRKKSWKELPPRAKVGTIVGAIVQLSLLFAAQRDISRRPAVEIRGSKAMWRVATLVNFIGPGCYFTFGIKRAPALK